MSEKTRRYRERNIEKIRQKAREYNQKNKELIKRRKKDYQNFVKEDLRLYEIDLQFYGTEVAVKNRIKRKEKRKLDKLNCRNNSITENELRQDENHREFAKQRSEWILKNPTLVHTWCYKLFIQQLKRKLNYKGVRNNDRTNKQ